MGGMRIGDIHLHPVSDGTFLARPSYFGHRLPPDAHPEFFRHHNAAWLPIGCFLARTRDRVVLVDAGLGPAMMELWDGMHLVGGQLPTGLRSLGVTTTDVTDVICTHFHGDHVGWLFDLDATPVFPNATIWFGDDDWRHFVTGSGEMADHIRAGLRSPAHSARMRPIDHDTTVAPGITAVLAPGHTPGHMCVVIASGQDRALLLGDAVTCPLQLDEPTWHSVADVDPALADRTRERLWRELEDDRTTGVGAHFPELQFGRVLPGTARRWFT
jgi:glyoxylase-like metal-dependent hydrolase (beta-lactamase superfamily II)